MKMKKISLGYIFIYVIFILLCIYILYPIWCIIVVSLTGKEEITKYGFSLWMREIDFSAYTYLLKNDTSILSAYGVTILVSIVGTVIGCITSIMYAYALSRRDFPFARFFSFILLFTMFFNGGMAASYIVNVSILILTVPFPAWYSTI